MRYTTFFIVIDCDR